MPSRTPVAMFVYNRPDHAARTLDALRGNTLAAETDVFVFSDGPKNAADEAGVAEVRRLFESGDGFASMTLYRRESNAGLAQSIITGVSEVVAKHGRVIVIEDDLVTHPYALEYFNRMLDRYAETAGVFSVSGYSHPAAIMPIPDDYEFDVYAIPRMQCWGWATWQDRWEKADFAVPDFAEFNASPGATAAYAHWIGGDSLNTLRACMRGDKDVWACRWVYTHFKHHAVCLCPTRSLINNIGMDGSGSNCGPTDTFEQELSVPPVDEWNLPGVAYVEPRIFETFMQIMDRNRVVNRIALAGAAGDKNQTNEAATTSEPDTPATRPHAPRATLPERIKYWSSNPMKLLQRLKEKYQERQLDTLIARMPAEHERLSAKSTTPMIRLGTDYGGWWVPEQGLGPEDFVVSAGAGEDISFDIELARRYGCQVLILDPTPRAVAHFDATCAAIRNGEPAPINNSDTEFYEATADDVERLDFRPWGLWTEDTNLRFYAPANPKHVSHSIGNLHQTGDGFDAECVTLATLLQREQRDRISVLKIDIEGAEFGVLDDMIKSGLRPRFILVEYHAGQNEVEKKAKPRTLASLKRLHDQGYRIVENRGWDYVLELQ